MTSPCMEKNTLPLISGLWSVALSFEFAEILRYNATTPSNSPPSLLWQAAPTQTRLAYQILGRGEVLFVGNHCVVVKRFGNQDNNTNMLCFPWQRENTVTKTRYVLTFLCVSHSINTTQLFANRRSILLRSSESRNFLVQ